MHRKNAVLLLTWRRPEYLSDQITSLREYKPKRVYFFSDGWNEDGSQDEKDIKRCRRDGVRLIDWDCEVISYHSDRNLGCGKGVKTAIDWFFRNEEQGIILEDDIIPSRGFWKYMDTYLERYKDDSSVAAVAGSSFVQARRSRLCDSYLSSICQVWGWGTWARAWNLNAEIDGDYHDRARRELSEVRYPEEFIDYWISRFKEVYEQRIDTWDYGWIYSCIKNRMRVCTPIVNLTHNVGFSDKATHTKTRSYKEDLPGRLLGAKDRVMSAEESVAVDCAVFNSRFSQSARKKLRRLSGLSRQDRYSLWAPVDVDKEMYLEGFSRGRITYGALCWELDRVWDQLECVNTRSCSKQKEALSSFYRHPVWSLNGLYSMEDPISRNIRLSITKKVAEMSPEMVIDFGGGSGVLVEMIKQQGITNAYVYDPYTVGKECTPSERADVVIALDVLEHTDEPLKLVEEIKAITRVGGHIMFGNCFHPVIKCHMHGSFYLRYIFRIACKLSGLRHIENIGGADYVSVFRLENRDARVRKDVDWTLRLVGSVTNVVGCSVKSLIRVVIVVRYMLRRSSKILK